MSQVSYGTITIVDTTDIERIYMVYAKSVSNTIPPSDELTWSESIASAPGEGDFIWQKTVVEKAITEEKTYSDPVCVTGSSGQGVEKIINYYCNYGQGQPEENYSGWQLEIPEYDSNKPNYWTKVVVIYSDDTREDFQASGTIATFESEKAGTLDSLEVTLTPIQDLHGYDRPWVGGGGKNKFPLINGGTNHGITAVTNSDGSVTLNGTASGNGIFFTDYFTVKAGEYIITGNKPNNDAAVYLNGVSGSASEGARLTIPEDISVRGAVQVYDGKTVSNYTVYPMLRLATETDATYAPYSNICPISGWDSVEVTRTGKNLLNLGNLIIKNVPYTDMVFSKAILLKAGVYTTSIENVANATSWRFGFRFFESDGTVIMRAMSNGVVSFNPNIDIADTYNNGTACLETHNGTRTYFTLTLSRDVYVCFSFSSGDVSGTTTVDFQLELGATATSYEPYQGQTYQTTLPQTVYGGTLDVVSGVLTVDRAMYEPTSIYAVGQGSGKYYWIVTNDLTPPAPENNAGDLKSNIFRASYGVSEGNCYITAYGKYIVAVPVDQTLNTKALANAWMQENHPQFCYLLKEPQTYQLTPTQIDSLLGRNNVWSDGAVEVEGHTISKKDIMIYKDNGLTDVANKSAEANTNAAEALEKANDGIISTTQLWYQTNGTSAPSVPTNHNQVDQGTATYNNWRSVRPNNSVNSYKYYYYCYEYLHGDGTYTYSAEAILDTSNLSQYQIDQLQVRIKKIWSNSTGSYMASGIGNNEVNIDNSSTYGFNSKSTTTGVSFNYNAIPLTSLGTDGIKLYSPTLTNGVITGSRLDATLNTNGLFLNRGGIESGGLSSGNGYVYLSTLDKTGITINGHLPGTNDPKWRAIIGSKFGVDSEGNLYANNANISGKIMANSGSNVYTITETDEIIGDVYDKASETKIIKYAYSTTLSGDDLSLTNTELPYRGIYVGPVDETAFEDFNNYTWELNPVWASKYADQYLHSIEDGIAIYNSDLGSDTYAGLSATALTFFLANIEQMRVGYEASIDDYGVIASSLIALGSGAGIKFDNYGHTDEGARGRYVWEVRDNGHLSLKLF